MIGYALGMLDFKGKNLLVSLVIALSIIPTEAVIINRFMVANQLHILNSYAGLALPTIGYPMNPGDRKIGNHAAAVKADLRDGDDYGIYPFLGRSVMAYAGDER